LAVNEEIIETQSGENLTQRVVRGGFWVFALRIVSGLFGFIRTIILARILSPNDFGLMGIAFLAISTLETFSQTGFGAALVQKKGDIRDYLDTSWTFFLIRGLILFAILFFAAPYISHFFNAPASVPIIRVMAISLLIGGATNIGTVYFTKDLRFNKVFFYNLSATMANITVAISAALILRSVWALVFGLLAGSVTQFIVSYLIHSYRPRISFDLGKVKELFGFGKWFLGSSILIFLITQGDDIFVGKLLGVAALGFYQMAYRISNMPATEITHVISQVTFPTYSKLQDDIPRLREAYLNVLRLTAFLSFPIAGLIFILAPDFTRIFLGEKWMPMVPAMQVLAIWGVIRSVGTVGPVAQAIGKPRIATSVQFVQLILLAVLIYPLSAHWGILGTSLAVVLASLVARIISTYMVIKIIRCRRRSFCGPIAFPLIGTIIMILSTFFMKIYWVTQIEIPEFSVYIGLSILIYLGITCLFDKTLNYRMQFIIRESLSLFKCKS